MTNEEYRENIRLNLLDLRIKTGFTQADIGSITDKKYQTVASWENGKSLPDLPTLYKLSKLYSKPLEYFFENRPGE